MKKIKLLFHSNTLFKLTLLYLLFYCLYIFHTFFFFYSNLICILVSFPVPGRASSVSFVRGPRSVRHTPERIILVTARRIPFAVFSLIPYNRERFSRQDLRREGRRRHVSGPRPLSAISDGLDPFALMGVQKAQDGQVRQDSHSTCLPTLIKQSIIIIIIIRECISSLLLFLKISTNTGIH